MKNFFFLLLPLVLIISTCEKKDDGPNPDSIVNILDALFLSELIKQGVDTNGDSLISYGEAVVVESIIFLDGKDIISDLTGIEAFINLDTLRIIGGNISTLDVSKNTKLRFLACVGSGLESLNVSGNSKLTHLDCYSSRYGENHLTSLDISNNTALRILGCGGNELTTLDVSNNTALEYLYFSDNQLTTLDVSNNTALIHIFCMENQLTTLDVSNNFALSFVLCTNMPSMYKVCVWTMPFPPEGLGFDTTGSPNVYFTTDCSE